MTQPWETHNLLFAYGSLLIPTGLPDVDEVMSGKTVSLGKGYIHGRLYDLGDYPGVKPFLQSESGLPPKVWGRLLGLPDPDPVFAVLDHYEGFDRAKPLESEFARGTAAVVVPEAGRTSADDTAYKAYTAQVYFYNPPVHGKKLISSGDYLAYKHAKESRP